MYASGGKATDLQEIVPRMVDENRKGAFYRVSSGWNKSRVLQRHGFRERAAAVPDSDMSSSLPPGHQAGLRRLPDYAHEKIE